MRLALCLVLLVDIYEKWSLVLWQQGSDVFWTPWNWRTWKISKVWWQREKVGGGWHLARACMSICAILCTLAQQVSGLDGIQFSDAVCTRLWRDPPCFSASKSGVWRFFFDKPAILAQLNVRKFCQTTLSCNLRYQPSTRMLPPPILALHWLRQEDMRNRRHEHQNHCVLFWFVLYVYSRAYGAP